MIVREGYYRESAEHLLDNLRDDQSQTHRDERVAQAQVQAALEVASAIDRLRVQLEATTGTSVRAGL